MFSDKAGNIGNYNHKCARELRKPDKTTQKNPQRLRSMVQAGSTAFTVSHRGHKRTITNPYITQTKVRVMSGGQQCSARVKPKRWIVAVLVPDS